MNAKQLSIFDYEQQKQKEQEFYQSAEPLPWETDEYLKKHEQTKIK